MKFRIQLKDPDGFGDGFDEAVKESIATLDLTDDEKEAVAETRGDNLRKFASKWVEFGEYITIEFDTDAGTATVLEN